MVRQTLFCCLIIYSVQIKNANVSSLSHFLGSYTDWFQPAALVCLVLIVVFQSSWIGCFFILNTVSFRSFVVQRGTTACLWHKKVRLLIYSLAFRFWTMFVITTSHSSLFKSKFLSINHKSNLFLFFFYWNN